MWCLHILKWNNRSSFSHFVESFLQISLFVQNRLFAGVSSAVVSEDIDQEAGLRSLCAKRWGGSSRSRGLAFQLAVIELVCVLTGKWEELEVNKSHVLGEPIYFEIGAEIILKDKRVYIKACHVTPSEDSSSTQRYDVISNFG